MKTSTPKAPAPRWLLIDAEGQVLGRLAARVALMLRGKNKALFSPHQLCGDHVVVVNAAKLTMTPAKFR
ncbi:MAG TPA: 50S ribosomal protein L13, partial [Candidatus Peribacter riflensis]|nr:50S ribosomal protein L13 [Candidatus Peribacter riflensis]